jgi:hypothetical protein
VAEPITQGPTHLSADDLEHYKRAAQRYVLAEARFQVAKDAWEEEQAALATKYQVDGPAQINTTTGAITRLPPAEVPVGTRNGTAD